MLIIALCEHMGDLHSVTCITREVCDCIRYYLIVWAMCEFLLHSHSVPNVADAELFLLLRSQYSTVLSIYKILNHSSQLSYACMWISLYTHCILSLYTTWNALLYCYVGTYTQ